jgi:hypothetical protein
VVGGFARDGPGCSFKQSIGVCAVLLTSRANSIHQYASIALLPVGPLQPQIHYRALESEFLFYYDIPELSVRLGPSWSPTITSR